MWVDEFFEKIREKLNADVIDDKSRPMVAHFDMFFNQYMIENDETDNAPEAYQKPAVFYAAQPYEYTQLGLSVKSIDEFVFELHIESEVVQEVDSSTPKNVRDLAHKHTQLQAKIEEVLQGFNGNQVTEGFNGFGSIMCIGGVPYQPYGLSMVHILRFKTRITVNTAKKIYTKIKQPSIPTPVNDEVTINVTHL